MHVILFSQICGCYGNGNSQKMTKKPGSCYYSKTIHARLMKLNMWIDNKMKIMHVILFFRRTKYVVAMVTEIVKI